MPFLRKGTIRDLGDITNIIESAKYFLKSQNIDQWQQGYPDEDQARVDITRGHCYVLVCDSKIAAIGTITTDIDSGYTAIKGSWKDNSNEDYASLHRIAVSERFRGKHLAQKLLLGLIAKCREMGFVDIRADTHKDNKAMQTILTKNGFGYQGIIFKAEDCSPRMAFQLLLD
ncbi:LAQU0S08e00122g1_1 [Lachancea quebecensis]|uniref:LAQU0S08e00122g1_1 n=1 Tax=Lachancea quebecensis TaxID=1654605 RepID=A0A0N7MLR3_9SACH|nr:LAQU0S08e00122g1_1 [Lachancea quebecensis]